MTDQNRFQNYIIAKYTNQTFVALRQKRKLFWNMIFLMLMPWAPLAE